MSAPQLRWPESTVPSLVAGLCTWVAMFAWTGFAEKPAQFMVPAFVACLIVAAGGALLRELRASALLVVAGQVLLLLLWLNHRWAADLAAGGWLPTPASLRELGDTFARGAAAAQDYAAPVPDSAPEFYPLMIGAGAAAAVLVDFLACGLRRVPLAGLPLLAMYSAPVSILAGSVSWVKFVAGALTFLLLLATDEAQRLALWGRQLSERRGLFDSQSTTVSAGTIRASARKIAFTATGIAVVVPIFVPTLTTGLFDGQGTGTGPGDSVSISNPMVDLKRDLTRGADDDLLWVRTPDRDPSYLRVTVLDAFDGDTWKPSGRDIPPTQRARGLLPVPPGLTPEVARTEVPYSIEVGPDFRSRWLPAPYPLASIRTDGDWRYDVSTIDFISAIEGQTTANMEYDLRALLLEPTAAQLAGAPPAGVDITTRYTAIPRVTSPFVRDLARKVTDKAETRFEKAVALQQWFREDGGFRYSLERAPGNGLRELDAFLSKGEGGRVGYCEQFAAAMALMGRVLGIPSRVAFGFLRPEKVGGDTWVYSSHDLHTWPEMYFEGVGWVRFEPTPADRAASVPDYTSQQIPGAAATPSPSSAAPQQNRLDRPTDTAPQTQAGGRGGSRAKAGLLVGFVGALLLVGLALLPRMGREWVRRRRWAAARTPAQRVEAAWAELRDSAVDLGVPWDDSVTLRRRARDLVQAFGAPLERGNVDRRSPVRGAAANPEATQALDRLVKRLERARYARTMAHADHADLADDVRLCTRALEDGATRKRRTRATWLPASVLRRARAGLWGRRPRELMGLGAEPGVDHAV